jgi:hypothetical protein
MSAWARLAGALPGLLVAACAGASPESTPSRGSAISGGEISGAEDDAVVRVTARQPRPFPDVACTGTLLAPNVLLTALHCVAAFDLRKGFFCGEGGTLAPPDLGYGRIGETLEPGNITITFGSAPVFTADARAALVLGTGSTHACVDDLAFVVLDRDLPSPGFRARLERPVTPGERMTLIGFGLSDSPGTVRMRRSQVPVLSVGPDQSSEGLQTAPPRSFVVGDGPCDGDSGGPALSDETAAVTGIYSLNFGGECGGSGKRHTYTKLAPFANLLERAFTSAGREPRREAEYDPIFAAAGGCSMVSLAPAYLGSGPRGALLALSAAFALLLCRRPRTLRFRARQAGPPSGAP